MNIIFDFKIFFKQRYGGPSRYFFNLFESINKNKDYKNSAHIVSPIYYNEYLNNSSFKNKIIGKNFQKLNLQVYFINLLIISYQIFFLIRLNLI